MGTLTKHTPDVTVAGNYYVNGSIANPVTADTLQLQPVSPATQVLTTLSTFTGADIPSGGFTITFEGPNSGDSTLKIYFLKDTDTTPTIPRDEMGVLVVNSAGDDTNAELMDKLETALTTYVADGLLSSTRTTESGNERFTIVPQCGGVWTQTVSDSSLSSNFSFDGSINGGQFISSTTSPQDGVGIEITNTPAGGVFANLRIVVDGDLFNIFGPIPTNTTRQLRNSTTLSGAVIDAEVASGGGFVGNALYSQVAGQRLISTDSSIDNSTDTAVITQLCTDIATAFNRRFATVGPEPLIAVGDGTKVLFFNTDISNLTATPTVTITSVNQSWAANTTTGTREVFPFDIDPHKVSNVAATTFLNPASTVTRAANSFQFGAYSVSTFNNYSIDCSRGFAYGDRFNKHDSDWRQINITKSVDAGFNFSVCMLLTTSDSKRKWRWVNFDIFPTLAGDTSIMTGEAKTQVLDWENVFFRWSSQNGSRFNFNFSPESKLVNCGVVISGTGTAANAFIILSDTIKQLTPFTIEVQSDNISSFAFQGFNRAANNDTFDGSQFWSGAGYQGEAVSSTTPFTLFQSGNDHFKMLDFTNNGTVNTNQVTYGSFTNVSDDSSVTMPFTFSPSFFNSDGTDLNNVRCELRYGTTSSTSPIAVKEAFETGPIGGTTLSASRFSIDTNASLSIGDVFTFPRPHSQTSITITLVSGTPTQAEPALEVNIGATAAATIQNIFNALNSDRPDNIGFYRDNTGAITLSNQLGGVASIGSFDGSGVTVTSAQVGAAGFGTNTHPFATSGYIGTEGLANIETQGDNTFKQATSLGGNPGLFVANMKSVLVGLNVSQITQGSSFLRYLDDYVLYIKHAARRPQLLSFKFSDGPQILSNIPIVDIHWEDVTKSTVEAYTRTSMDNMNDVYRWIENETDDRSLTGQSDLTGVYDRFIDFTEPVTAAGLIDFEDLDIEFNTTGINPEYELSGTKFKIPVQSSIVVGTSTFGVTTTKDITVISAIDFNTVTLDGDDITISASPTDGNFVASGDIAISASPTNGNYTATGDIDITAAATNGTYRAGGTVNLDDNASGGVYTAGTVDSSGVSITNVTINADTHTMTTTDAVGCTLGPENEGSGDVYDINHSGGSFDGCTLADTFTLNTTDSSLHGLTAANGIINVLVDDDFSVDSPGAIENSTFNMNNITADREFTIDEDLGDCDLVNTTSFTWTLVLGPNGVVPNTAAGGSLTGNFVISRSINVGLTNGETVNYTINNALSNVQVINSTFTATTSAPNIPFSSTFAVDIYVKQTGSNGYKTKEILILNNTQQDIVRSFELEESLNVAIQDSSENRQIVDDYVDAITLTIDTGDRTMANVICPPSFTSGGSIQTPNDNTYWDPKGSRGAGQYALKVLAEKSNYGILVLSNKVGLSEAQPQLFQITAADTVTFTTGNVQLHSQIGVTVNSFFPAQFEVGPGVTNNIIGTPNGLVNIYQSANVVINTNDNLAFVKGELGDELNARIVTKENIENLGLIIPANPNSTQ